MDNLTDYLRFLLAIALFAISAYLVFDLLVSGFNLYVLVGAVLGFMLTHLVKPDFRKSSPDSFDLWDAIDLLIDLPYRAVALALRSVGSLVGRGGLDLD